MGRRKGARKRAKEEQEKVSVERVRGEKKGGREAEKEQVKCVEGVRREDEEGKEKEKGETEREIG